MCNDIWIYPPAGSSHHQDDIAFLVANPYRPLFATVTGGRYIQAIIVLQEFDDFAAAHPLSFTTPLKLSVLDVIGGINELSYISSVCELLEK